MWRNARFKFSRICRSTIYVWAHKKELKAGLQMPKVYQKRWIEEHTIQWPREKSIHADLQNITHKTKERATWSPPKSASHVAPISLFPLSYFFWHIHPNNIEIWSLGFNTYYDIWFKICWLLRESVNNNDNRQYHVLRLLSSLFVLRKLWDLW